MDIRDQITWLRCFDDDEADKRMADRCADTIEKLLAVYEATDAAVVEHIWNEQEHSWACKILDALCALDPAQTRQEHERTS